MKVSIIVPVYNVEDYIEECLTSIKNQTYHKFEVIILDDCGQDKSIEKVFFYLNDPRFKLVQHEKNKGLGGARNTAFNSAQGDFIFYLDSDDVLHPNALELLIDAQKESGSDLVYSSSFKFISNETPSFAKYDKCNDISFKKPEEIISIRGFAVWGVLIKRRLLCENEILFPERISGEDVPFTSLLLQSAKNVCFLNNQLVAYRWMRPNSLTTNSTKHARDMLHLLEQYISQIKSDSFAAFIIFNVIGKVVENAYINEINEVLDNLLNNENYKSLKNAIIKRNLYSYLNYKNKLIYLYVFSGIRFFYIGSGLRK